MAKNEIRGRKGENEKILAKLDVAPYVPRVGDRIRITKRSIHTGESAGMQPGESMETILRSEIGPGQNIVFDGGNSSAAQKAYVEGKKVIVHTVTSIYEIEKLES